MSKKDLLIKILLPFFILLIAAVLTVVMVTSRKAPRQEEQAFYGSLVEIATVDIADREIRVAGTGTVQPSREVAITPQVSGRIVALSERMVAGGFFRKDDLLFTIEDTDYQLALERARANLASTDLELAKIKSQAEIARLEWQRLALQDRRKPEPLVLFEPQLKNAEAQRSAARAAVEQAELDLRRTRIHAPFNCFIRAENVEYGQYVREGSSVATIAGTDDVDIIIPLPLEELHWIGIPGQGAAAEGPAAEVLLELGNQVFTWPGRVVRLLGDIDPNNRMASLVVSVADPFGRAGSPPQRPPLAPGTFVQVVVPGANLSDVAVVPRQAVHDDGTVWLADAEDRLRIRKVDILRREREVVLISAGLEAGERIVLTNLSGAADGMLLRPQVAGNRQ